MQKRIVVWLVLVFCLGVSQNAWAKTDLGWRSIGVNAGFVDPDNVDGTVGFGAFANLGNLSPDVRLQPNVGYWSKSQDEFGVKATISDISFSTRALYMFHNNSAKFHPYAGGGPGLHIVKAKVSMTTPVAMEASDSETKLGLDLVGGFTTQLSQKNDLCVDLGYTAVSDVAQLSMKVGVSFDLGGSPRAESVKPSTKPSTHKTTKARH